LDQDTLARFLLVAPVLLFSMVAHEYAHGYAAFRQGDLTAYQLGLLTWNPRPYIDPVGSILVPLLTLSAGYPFGWARSAPINTRNFRHFKRGDIIVSLAGVTANLLIAIACALLIVLAGAVGRAVPAAAPTLAILQLMCRIGVLFNLVLVFLNLVPIPPTDGSRVMKYLLPTNLAVRYQQIGNVGFLLVFALVVFPATRNVVFAPVAFCYSMVRDVTAPFALPSPLAL
jgi:Zn-dependent protease